MEALTEKSVQTLKARTELFSSWWDKTEEAMHKVRQSDEWVGCIEAEAPR